MLDVGKLEMLDAVVETEITCLATLSSDPGHRSRVSHVILGLDTALRGALAVLDIAESRIVR